VGDFDVSSHKKWLLHTWSLSVEWQFYMFYPIVLFVAYKFGSKITAQHTVKALCLLSLFYCVYLSYVAPNSAFYILPTRAWEMLIGGLAFLYPLSVSTKAKKALEILGLTFIIAAYLCTSNSDVWPGYLAFLPVAGAYILILANNNNSYITGNIVMQHIGTYSYSIYLWHWPIQLAFSYFGLSTMPYLILGMALSLITGYFSYRFIEMKSSFQIDTSSIFKALTFLPVLLSATVCLVCLFIYKSDGIPSRLDNRIHIAANELQNRPSCSTDKNNVEHCTIGKKENIVALILGDSHFKVLTPVIAESVRTDLEGVLLILAPACTFILNANITSNKDCLHSNYAAIELINKTHVELPIFYY